MKNNKYHDLGKSLNCQNKQQIKEIKEMKKMKNFCIITTTYLLLLTYMVMTIIGQYALMTVCAIVVAIIIYANLRDEREDD